jgi:hypothetical protein
LVYADGVNKRESINTIKWLSEASREVGLEVNTEKTKYMVMSHHQNAGQNHNLLIANKSSENMAMFKHTGTTITNQTCIHKEIKSRLNSGNACHHLDVFLSPLKM